MTDRYAVFGNPVGHSRSPQIHAAFARQCGQDLSYEAILAPVDGFARALEQFRAAGGRGCNVTLPFKEEAFRLARRPSPRAAAAKAANTLSFADDGIAADNTDGVGLVRDLAHNLGCDLAGRRVLLLGAGGAARGVLLPLLEAGIARLTLANRTAEKAHGLASEFATLAPGHRLDGCGFAELVGRSFDLVVNATSAGLAGARLALPPGLFAPDSLAYDMVYGKGVTPFLCYAHGQGAGRLADGLGMLVEQAAEAFLIWRGVRPDTAPVLEALRS